MEGVRGGGRSGGGEGRWEEWSGLGEVGEGRWEEWSG